MYSGFGGCNAEGTVLPPRSSSERMVIMSQSACVYYSLEISPLTMKDYLPSHSPATRLLSLLEDLIFHQREEEGIQMYLMYAILSSGPRLELT